jgi:tetratricopeptide (TPR) repeat protein
LSTAAADLELMRASRLLESDPAAAARRASEILVYAPDHDEAKLLLATACRKLGDPATAVATLETLAGASRGSAFIRLELGRAYEQSGRSDEALASFREAVELDAGLADAWRELAAALFATGDTLGGDRAYSQYARLMPDAPELRDAVIALGENRIQAAEALVRQHLKQAPEDVSALLLLADASDRREDAIEAERYLLECLRLAPGHAFARFRLASLLYESHRNTEALPHLDRLLALDPGNAEYLSLRAQILRLMGGHAEALALMNRAVTEHPDAQRAWLVYGHLMRETGDQPRAIEMYRRALALQPDSGLAYSSLANLKTFRFTASDLSAMQEQLAQSAAIGIERTHLEFALGKALEDEGRFADSFQHYAHGNSLYRATFLYDADAMSRSMQHISEIESAAFFRERTGWGTDHRDPIFIVGLPRCGSTLLEQMLATHSQVEGTRELTDLPALAAEVTRRTASAGSYMDSTGAAAPLEYPEPLVALRRDELASLAGRYLELTAAHRRAGKPRFVDKMLANFGHVGFIHLMFPDAAIIDVRRHPLGNGFSCYKQIFARGNRFTYDLTELGRYYRDYADLMRHFDEVLPGRVLRVHYEQLIADPQAQLRRVLEHFGFPSEAQCLRFYENRRVVQTISSEQVRRPIYAESVEQWRHYEPWLGPLKDALADLLSNY